MCECSAAQPQAEGRDDQLLSIAALGDTKERAVVISALSDVGNPAPFLQEALHLTGLHAWRRANSDALKKFASWMSAKRPRVGPSLTTSVRVYLGKGGWES